jgi:hypothetical protein
MITCPNCAAGNKAGSSVCRMCAVSLEGLTDAPAPEVQSADASSAAAAIPREVKQQEEKMPAQGIVCPECNTSNEVGWSFCQQCGTRLPKSPAPPSSGELRSARGLTTVPDQQAISGANSAQDLNTVAEKSPASEPSFKTVAEKSFAADDNIKTVAEKVFQADDSDSATTVAQKVPAVESSAQDEPPSPAPANIAEPPAEPPEASSSKSDPWADLPTVVTEAPLRPTAETPAMTPASESEAVPPPAHVPVPAPESTQHVQSVSGVLCSQCGQTSNASSSFCANCGAPFSFGRTMVISSESGESGQPATPPIRGRLHLVMEGGQPGEVYELGDETSIGRTTGQITFPHDGFMSGRHARIVRRGGKFALSDEGSRNGTFVKIKGDVELEPGDMILVGKQLFRFEV